jgi:hypothetical protein
MVECLPSKGKALSSNASMEERKRGKREGRREGGGRDVWRERTLSDWLSFTECKENMKEITEQGITRTVNVVLQKANTFLETSQHREIKSRKGWGSSSGRTFANTTKKKEKKRNKPTKPVN